MTKKKSIQIENIKIPADSQVFDSFFFSETENIVLSFS